jgi:hypothetical protein
LSLGIISLVALLFVLGLKYLELLPATPSAEAVAVPQPEPSPPVTDAGTKEAGEKLD